MIDKTVASKLGPSGNIFLNSSLMADIFPLTQLSFSPLRMKVLGIPPVKACLDAVPGVRFGRNWKSIKYCTRICRRND